MGKLQLDLSSFNITKGKIKLSPKSIKKKESLEEIVKNAMGKSSVSLCRAINSQHYRLPLLLQ